MDITFESVRDVIVDTLSCEQETLTLDTNLFDDLKIDSLEAVELSLAMEETFGVGIADEDMQNVRTVRDILAYLIDRKQS
ncbi:MAG: acyl carrier protein [Oscillospiraceae bacterium]|jgi:acyl carrier protein